ncbi:MAG: CpsB/CapC family capsule biosynthesis tyrosine phosphatase [Clostridia bacterium]
MRIYDMHCHIMPSVDDGAKTKEDSLNMLKKAKENGINYIFATPHYNEVHGFLADNTKHIDWLTSVATELGISVFKGCELFITSNTLEMLSKPNTFTLGQSNYLLVEFPYSIGFDELIQHIYQIVSMGYIPIIAHIERYYNCYKSDISTLIKMGALLQVNSTTILKGSFRAKQFCKKLIKNNYVSFIANDAHRADDYNLKQCMQYIKKHYGQEMAKDLFVNNANIIVEQNQKIYA